MVHLTHPASLLTVYGKVEAIFVTVIGTLVITFPFSIVRINQLVDNIEVIIILIGMWMEIRKSKGVKIMV